MSKKAITETCCLTLPLILEKWQSDRLEKRFEIARQLYNTLLNFELKKHARLKSSEEYIVIQTQIDEINGKKGPGETSEKEDKKQLKELYKKRDEISRKYGFSEYGFKSDMGMFYKHFNENIGSKVAVHGIAPMVWAAFDKLFYGNGKKVHFKKRGDLTTLRGYSSAKSGGSEIMFRGGYVEWKGLKIRVKHRTKNTYESEMLKRHIKYCRIVKKPGNIKPHWYVQLMLEGRPVIKTNPATGEALHPVGSGAVGIDIGTQTIAYVSQSEVTLIELTDKVENIEKEKRTLQRKMDRSRRACNPGNYAEDGTIKRGVKLTKNKSKRYLKDQNRLAYLMYKQAETRKRQHNELANHLLTLGDRFIVEKMKWSALARRAKETEVSEKTGRFKRKKRFGKSIGNKAPARPIKMLHQKLITKGYEGVVEVSTGLRASQYNHITDDYVIKDLSQRWNEMPDGRRIQRDIYSAFLLQHTLDDASGFDKDGLKRDYEGFVIKHDEAIKELLNTKTIASMGIRRSKSNH